MALETQSQPAKNAKNLASIAATRAPILLGDSQVLSPPLPFNSHLFIYFVCGWVGGPYGGQRTTCKTCFLCSAWLLGLELRSSGLVVIGKHLYLLSHSFSN